MPTTPLTERARSLRRSHTPAERMVWSMLRARQLGGFKWKRQVPRGPYIVDFLCDEAGLVLELDGDDHALKTAYDARRTAWLEADGIRVLRFSNHDVRGNLNGVCDAILAACRAEAPHPPVAGAPGPSLSPQAGRGDERDPSPPLGEREGPAPVRAWEGEGDR